MPDVVGSAEAAEIEANPRTISISFPAASGQAEGHVRPLAELETDVTVAEVIRRKIRSRRHRNRSSLWSLLKVQLSIVAKVLPAAAISIAMLYGIHKSIVLAPEWMYPSTYLAIVCTAMFEAVLLLFMC
ncbi:hypothetical protein BC829DRAFT_136816 [Chytridium lagenaria]|nr:hypothetical protein BC829DRAFT_136816 [Chytridium lagenaria]